MVIESMRTNDASRPGYGQALSIIGEKLRSAGKHGKARQVYTAAVAADPNNSNAIRWQTEVAIACIRDGNDAAAAVAYNSLLTRYAGRTYLPRAVCRIGDACVDVGKYDQADQLYRYAAEHWPDSKYMLSTRAGQAKVLIAKG
jgi:tetratricopeptide (TPR) repeat protein